MPTMTCDEVRELLPEHLLGGLEGPEDLEVRRHLRGCSTCREERMKLEDGVAALSRAVHDQEPPADLRGRVLRTLDEEWQDAGRPLVYEGDASKGWSSWAIVFVKAPGYTGDATATLIGTDGQALALPPLRVTDGEAHTWLVTGADLSGYDRLTITTPDGNVVATGAIHPA